jgi:hypothetical protein
MKLAPTLQRLVFDHHVPSAVALDVLRMELRALLAVARAARMLKRDIPPWLIQGRLDRALARLEKVSEEKP